MAVGLRGRAVRFQQTPQSVSPKDIISRGLDAEQELYGGAGPSMMDLPEDMQMIDGVTDRIYEDVAQVNNFANTMWANYRIDVTKPDLRNPLAMRANQQYLKMLSGLKYASNALQQSNKVLALDRQAEREGKGVIMADPQTQLYGSVAEGDRFVNTEIDPIAQQSNYAYAKMTDDPTAARKMQGAVNQNIQEATSLYEGLGRSKRAEVVKQQFQGPTYERDVRLDEEYWRNRQGQANDAKDVLNELEQIRTGLINRDPNAQAKLKAIPGVLNVVPINTGKKVGANITFNEGGNAKTVYVSFLPGDAQFGGRSTLNDILQRLNPGKAKLPSSVIVPYFEEFAKQDSDLQDPNIAAAFDNLLARAKTLYSTSTTKVDDKTVVTSEEKELILNTLDEAAMMNQLVTPEGRPIVEVSRSRNIVGSKKLILTLDDGSELEIDPKTQSKYLESLFEANSNVLLPIVSSQKDMYPAIEKVGEVSKAQNFKSTTGTDLDAEAKSIVDAFEKQLQRK